MADAAVKPRRKWLRRVAAVAVVVGVVLGLRLLWMDVLVDHVIVRNYGVVEEGKIYRTGRLTEQTLSRVAEDHKIKTIVDFGAYLPGSSQEKAEAEYAAAHGIKRVVLRLYGDGTGNPNAYVDGLRIITDPASQPVLVHCSAGSERTGAAVILYRTIYQHVPMEKAVAEAQEYKHNPRRNKQLAPYLAQWTGPIAEALKAGGEIPNVPAPSPETPATAPWGAGASSAGEP
jgi:hypothetical protein